MKELKGICSLEDLEEKCEELLKLERNWDGYDAEPVNSCLLNICKETVIKLEKEFFQIFPWYLCPSPDGGIQIETTGNDKELELEWTYEPKIKEPQIVFLIVHNVNKIDEINEKIKKKEFPEIKHTRCGDNDSQYCNDAMQVGEFPASDYEKIKQLINWIK